MSNLERVFSLGAEFTIQPGEEVDFSLHEDGEFVTFSIPMTARVIGLPINGGVPISIDGFDLGCSIFVHLPEKTNTENTDI